MSQGVKIKYTFFGKHPKATTDFSVSRQAIRLDEIKSAFLLQIPVEQVNARSGDLFQSPWKESYASNTAFDFPGLYEIETPQGHACGEVLMDAVRIKAVFRGIQSDAHTANELGMGGGTADKNAHIVRLD